MTKDAEQRVKSLEAELARLKNGIRLSGHSIAAPAGRLASGTVVGSEEMLLQVDLEGKVLYLNGPMATLMGIANRRAAVGLNLEHVLEQADMPGGGFHVEVLLGCIESCRNSNQASVVETVFPGLPASALPGTRASPNTDPILRIVANVSKGQIQVIAQDVTKLRWIESMFARYVSPQVIELLHGTASDEVLVTDSREISILFGDLRGFTSMCERLSAEEVRDTVNDFLTGMVQCIDRHRGTVDKFVGDEVMALFGAPLHDDHHALNAILTALDMQRVHQEWMADRLSRGLEAPPLGVGIATGAVVVGNIGTPSRMDYTALGRPVNLAARLCGKAEGDEILTTRETHRQALMAAQAWSAETPLPHIRFAKKGTIELKNVAEPLDVVRVEV
ncbi:MAG: adenylate/guanylate cyclase domain-containing protein [Myxococcota bacterium]